MALKPVWAVWLIEPFVGFVVCHLLSIQVALAVQPDWSSEELLVYHFNISSFAMQNWSSVVIKGTETINIENSHLNNFYRALAMGFVPVPTFRTKKIKSMRAWLIYYKIQFQQECRNLLILYLYAHNAKVRLELNCIS